MPCLVVRGFDDPGLGCGDTVGECEGDDLEDDCDRRREPGCGCSDEDDLVRLPSRSPMLERDRRYKVLLGEPSAGPGASTWIREVRFVRESLRVSAVF